MIYEPKSAAKAVKQRARKAVQYTTRAPTKIRVVQRPAANRVTAQPAAAASKVTGGKGYKTGMVLARAKLPRGTSEIAATRDRQKTLLSKGQYRDAEKVARESTSGMPGVRVERASVGVRVQRACEGCGERRGVIACVCVRTVEVGSTLLCA